MGNIVCKKCKAEANSKCPYCRNIFPDNQLATMYSNLITVEVGEGKEVELLDGSKPTIQNISLTVSTSHNSTNKETPEEHLLGLIKGLVSLECPEQAICDHHWMFKPGEKSSIGCGHGSKEKVPSDGE